MACSSKSCQLIVYGGGDVRSNESGGNGEENKDIDSSDWCSENIDLVLDLLPDLYSQLNILFSVGASSTLLVYLWVKYKRTR